MSFRKRYGPWALVTGASSGMGASFAKQLAEKGLNVVLVARREDRLRALSEALERSASVQTRVVSADLSRDDFIPSIAEATDGLEIGLLVNNAGLGVTGEFLANDLGAELGMLHLNCRAPVLLSHHFGRMMRDRLRGGIIFLSSIVAFAGNAVWSNYAATKGHNLLFAEGLAAELRRDGIHVLALCPGFARTEFMRLTPFGRVMSMDANAVVKVALRSLRRKRRVTAGLINKAIVFSTRLQPRALNSKIFRAVIRRVQSA